MASSNASFLEENQQSHRQSQQQHHQQLHKDSGLKVLCPECNNLHMGSCWPPCATCKKRHLGECRLDIARRGKPIPSITDLGPRSKKRQDMSPSQSQQAMFPMTTPGINMGTNVGVSPFVHFPIQFNPPYGIPYFSVPDYGPQYGYQMQESGSFMRGHQSFNTGNVSRDSTYGALAASGHSAINRDGRPGGGLTREQYGGRAARGGSRMGGKTSQQDPLGVGKSAGVEKAQNKSKAQKRRERRARGRRNISIDQDLFDIIDEGIPAISTKVGKEEDLTEMKPERLTFTVEQLVQEVRNNPDRLDLEEDMFKIDDVAWTLVTFASQDQLRSLAQTSKENGTTIVYEAIQQDVPTSQAHGSE